MPIHHKAYVIIDFNDDLYFRQYVEHTGRKFLRCLNSVYPEIELDNNFEFHGCITQQKQRKHKSLHYYLPNDLLEKLNLPQQAKKKQIIILALSHPNKMGHST
jgi:hypothetical protein